MEIAGVLVIAVLTFGVCFLFDKGYTNLFRNKIQHYSGLAVRINKRYAIFGLILIFFVMFSGARRLELRQNASYSNDPEYQKYVKTVPIILPFIPLYSVVKYKFLIA